MKIAASVCRDILNLSNVLTQLDRKKLGIVTILNIGLSALDLIGVTLIGLIGALTINGVRSQTPDGKIGDVIDFLNLSEVSFQSQVVILSFVAVFLLVTRTLLSIVITRKTLFFLSRRSAEIASRLISRVMSQPLSTLKQYGSQHIHYTLTTGTNSLALGVFGNLVSVISDLSLIIVLGVGITLIDPLTATFTILIFGSLMVFMYFLTNRKTQNISRKHSELSIRDSETLLELIAGYREAFIRNRLGYFVDKAKKVKWEIADYSAELSWMPNISKYVVEIAFTIGTLVIAALQFIANDSAQAVGSLTLFIAAGSRITPALLRVQQNIVSINGSIVRAKPTIELFNSTKSDLKIPEYFSNIDVDHIGFEPSIVVSDASFRYPESSTNILSNLSFSVAPGETIAIVGPSGAGKSTLVDLILGIYVPTDGFITLAGCSPAESIIRWPGAIGYVPQEVVLMSGSIAKNVASGFDQSEISQRLVSDALAIAQLEEFTNSLTNGIETEVGERGSRLSGGQRQRIGIARAMFTKPKLLVLDEATSSLDGQTESEISEAIQLLKGKVTLILVAHRLSTVQKADRIIYIEAGRIKSQGTFEDLRLAVPNFNKQAKLMGL